MRLRRSIVLCALVMVGVSVTAGTMSAHASQDTPRGNQIVGTITADILRAPDPRTESALGNTLADAQLAATQGTGAQIALVSPTSIGADLLFASSRDHEGDGVVTYREAPSADIQTADPIATQDRVVLAFREHTRVG